MKTKGRFEVATSRKIELSDKLFTEKEMRGLLRVEKDFIRENEYHVSLNQNDEIFYLFPLGKKQLYAISKKQSINPNGHFIQLLLLAFISKMSFEFRCSVPNVTMIFA